MVRIMAGAVVAAGQGKISASDIISAFESGVRPENILTLPPKGLTLERVEYDKTEEKQN